MGEFLHEGVLGYGLEIGGRGPPPPPHGPHRAHLAGGEALGVGVVLARQAVPHTVGGVPELLAQVAGEGPWEANQGEGGGAPIGSD